MAAQDILDFIPWDPDNAAQSQWLYDQRIACGWSEDAIPGWKDLVRSGARIFYWIVRLSSYPHKPSSFLLDT
jgi:hypothetical protein